MVKQGGADTSAEIAKAGDAARKVKDVKNDIRLK